MIKLFSYKKSADRFGGFLFIWNFDFPKATSFAPTVQHRSFVPRGGNDVATRLRRTQNQASIPVVSRRKFASQIRHGSPSSRTWFLKTFCPCQNKKVAIWRPFCFGRGRRTRTHDPWFWRPVLYQLSYTPVCSFLQRSILYHSFMQIASLFLKKDKVFLKAFSRSITEDMQTT